jgi:hypothetical protein
LLRTRRRPQVVGRSDRPVRSRTINAFRPSNEHPNVTPLAGV